MFDLKAKMLEKGLVTKEQVEKATAKKKPDNFTLKERKRSLSILTSQSKAEQYVTIRKWVELNRLDKGPSMDGEKFFLTSKDNNVAWLTLKNEVIDAIKLGNAGVIAYMSNHGLVHAVVPRDIAEDVGEVFPDWLKVLNEKL